MCRVFFILLILILFGQYIFSADKEINLEKYIYLKDTQWRLTDKRPVTVKDLLEKYIPAQTRYPNLKDVSYLKDVSKFEIFEVSSKLEENLDDISLPLYIKLDQLDQCHPLENSFFLPIVNFHIDFNYENNHGTNRFNNININPILNDQKISFNIDTNEFQKLICPINTNIWNHLHFNKIIVSYIDEKKIDLVPEKKYALKHKDISKNKIVVVNANDKHLKTLQCLNLDFKIFKVEEEIDIEINQTNNILEVGTKVYFKDRDFGKISNVDGTRVSIKIEPDFCVLNEYVFLNEDISFISWEDVKDKLDDEAASMYNWQKRNVCKEYKEYFPKEVDNYFITNKIAPKIKIRNNTNQDISINSFKFGSNQLTDFKIDKEIDVSSYVNTDKIKILVKYQADNKCVDCKNANSIIEEEFDYEKYSGNDVIEILLKGITTSASKPNVKITNVPNGVDAYFEDIKVSTVPITVPINVHTNSISLKFRKEGYEEYNKIIKFDKILHLGQTENVDCSQILNEMKRLPWPTIKITNNGDADANVEISIGDNNEVFTISPKESVEKFINHQLDTNKTIIEIKEPENNTYSFEAVRGGENISRVVKGVKKSYIGKLTNSEIRNQYNRLCQLYYRSKSDKIATSNPAKKSLKDFVEENKIADTDLRDLLTAGNKTSQGLSESDIDNIISIAFE